MEGKKTSCVHMSNMSWFSYRCWVCKVGKPNSSSARVKEYCNCSKTNIFKHGWMDKRLREGRPRREFNANKERTVNSFFVHDPIESIQQSHSPSPYAQIQSQSPSMSVPRPPSAWPDVAGLAHPFRGGTIPAFVEWVGSAWRTRSPWQATRCDLPPQ